MVISFTKSRILHFENRKMKMCCHCCCCAKRKRQNNKIATKQKPVINGNCPYIYENRPFNLCKPQKQRYPPSLVSAFANRVHI